MLSLDDIETAQPEWAAPVVFATIRTSHFTFLSTTTVSVLLPSGICTQFSEWTNA